MAPSRLVVDAGAKRAFSSSARALYNSAQQQALEQWQRSVSSKQVVEHDAITASPFNLMGNTLNDGVWRHGRLPSVGTELPAGWHQAYFPPRATEQELSPDGYEQDWKPPAPFTHRMWAGGQLAWSAENPLRVGDQAKMVSRLRDIKFRPAGRRGDSVFIWIDKEISNQHGWAMTETRSWVYVQPSPPVTAPHKRHRPDSPHPQHPPATTAAAADFTLELTPSPITLFRFSALTFNSHLIHYDHMYATEIEHHPGCLVHGPLSYTLMAHALTRHLQGAHGDAPGTPSIRSLEYRCRSPLIVNEPLRVQGKVDGDGQHYSLWIADPHGNMAVKGTAVVA